MAAARGGQARAEATALAGDVAWLSSVAAEADALRGELSLRCGELRSGLSLEQEAHRRAVAGRADALEARAHMQLRLEDVTAQLAACREAYAALKAQHEDVSGHYCELRRQCLEVRTG